MPFFNSVGFQLPERKVRKPRKPKTPAFRTLLEISMPGACPTLVSHFFKRDCNTLCMKFSAWAPAAAVPLHAWHNLCLEPYRACCRAGYCRLPAGGHLAEGPGTILVSARRAPLSAQS